MSNFNEWSIRTKLLILVSVVAIAIILPVSGARLLWDYQQSKNTLSQEISTLGRLLGDRSTAALAFNDARLAEENLEALSSMANIKKACIYLSDGTLFAEHTKHSARCHWDYARIERETKQPEKELVAQEWYTEDSFNVILPVQLGSNILGSIYIVSDMTLVHQRLQQQLTFSGFALIAVMLISGLLTGWVRKLIAGPVETLLTKYRSLFDYANDVILLSDAENGSILDINPAASRLYGYSLEELRRKTIVELSAPELLKAVKGMMQLGKRDTEAVYEDIHYTKDGHAIPVEVSSRCIEVDNKKAVLSIIRNLAERKKVEKALAESEIRFRALVEQSPISTQIYTPDGFTRMVNPAWEKFWKADIKTLVDYNILKDRQLTEKGVMPYIKAGFEGEAVDIPPILYNPADLHDLSEHPDIPNRWVRGFIYPIKDKSGAVSEVIVTHEDVTDKKFTEEAIKNIAAGVSAKTGEAFFQQLVVYLGKLLNTKYCFIGVIDENNPLLVNTLAVSTNGEITPNMSYQLKDTPCEKVVGDSTCAFTTNIQQQFPKDELLRQMDADSYIGTPLFDINGGALGLIVLIDVKPLEKVELVSEILQIFAARAGAELDRLNAESELSIKERAMEVAIEGIILTDTSEENNIIYANHAMELITGYSKQELLGKNLHILYGDNTDQSVVNQLDYALSNYLPRKQLMINYRKDGRYFWNEITFTPVRKEDSDEVTHFIGTCVDVTERYHTEEALRRSQKMEAIGQLAGGVAHDFNNQLGIIIGYLDFLRENVVGQEKPEQWVETATAATNRCIDLTRQLLIFSRRKTKQTVTTNLNEELRKMDKLIARSITPAIEVRTYLNKDVWNVNIDPGEFQDVMLNLVINARDAMPDGGKLIIETSNKPLDDDTIKHNPNLVIGDYVQIMVSDTGTGMDKATLERVFEPFFTTKPEGKGTGLGLAMVYGFTKRYGGDIKIYSELNQGTTFRIYIPRDLQQSDTATRTPSIKAPIPTGNETVLIVDDETDLLSLAEQYLKSLGYQTFVASSAETALALLEKHPSIQILFSDVVMPGGMNGFELAKKAKDHYPHIKVLITSGFTSNTIAAQGQSNFQDNMLQKPYRKADLAQRIRFILDQVEEPVPGNRNSAIGNSSTVSAKPADKFVGKRVLIVDDDLDILKLYDLNLKKLGLVTQLATNGNDAIAIFKQSKETRNRIDAIILDLDIPGSIDGKEISQQIHSMDPDTVLIVSSGDSGGSVMTNYRQYGFSAALEKDFDRDEISQVLNKLF